MHKLLAIHRMNALEFLPEHIITRQSYLNKALAYLNKDIIKIFTGQRRIGKSYLLFQLIKYFADNQPGSNIIFISKELDDFRFIN